MCVRARSSGSGGSFSATNNHLIISASVSDSSDSGAGAAAGHFSSYDITGRYGSSVLPLSMKGFSV